jgi:hypothetical protein
MQASSCTAPSQRCHRNYLGIQLTHALSIGEGERPPSSRSKNDVSNLEVGTTGRKDLADTITSQGGLRGECDLGDPVRRN